MSGRTWHGRAWPLTTLSALVVTAVLLPVAFLVWQASQAGWALIGRHLLRRLTMTLLVNTVELTVAVTVCAAVISVAAAWCVERTDLPGRRLWRAVLMVPLAIPDFVVGYTWSSLSPAVHGLGGAVLVMTLGLYPLAYLPVAAALRRADTSVYEVARSMGSGRAAAFWRVVMPQIRAAVLGGSMPRADEILGLVGLAGLGHRFPHQLSGGQQQRVAIARALASRPGMVLLDEPFASLDAALRTAVRADVLGVLRSTGTTAILVTHDQDEALSAADYVAVMRDGLVTQAGAPREIYECPADPWTASFVGTANLLPGWAVDGDTVQTVLGRHRLQRAPGRPAGSPAELTVLIRPEQIRMLPPWAGASTALVSAARYHGHDTLVTVRPAPPDGSGFGEAGRDEMLHVRITGSNVPGPGDRVGLEVHSPVMAWSVPRSGARAARRASS